MVTVRRRFLTTRVFFAGGFVDVAAVTSGDLDLAGDTLEMRAEAAAGRSNRAAAGTRERTGPDGVDRAGVTDFTGDTVDVGFSADFDFFGTFGGLGE